MKMLPEYIKAGFPTDKKIKADYSKMARMCREALASHPEDKDYLLAWEVVYLCSDKQYEASLKAGREVLPVLTLQDCIDDIERNELWCLEQLGRTPEAIDILKKKAAATKKGNERYSVYGAIRELYKKLNDRENMLRYGSMMLEESPDQMDVEELREQAELYEQNEDFLLSFKCYEMAAISESGESAWDWSMAGRALAMNGENEEAMFYFRVANKIDPKDSMIHYYLGQAYQDLGDQYRALHHYTEALKDRPDFPEVYNNMAALSFNEDGDIKSAIQHLEEALQHDPDDRMKIAVYKSLAQLHHKLANYDQHEYYKGKLLEAIGFPVDWEEGDDEEEKGEV